MGAGSFETKLLFSHVDRFWEKKKTILEELRREARLQVCLDLNFLSSFLAI
jgi:hypothetical protein